MMTRTYTIEPLLNLEVRTTPGSIMFVIVNLNDNALTIEFKLASHENIEADKYETQAFVPGNSEALLIKGTTGEGEVNFKVNCNVIARHMPDKQRKQLNPHLCLLIDTDSAASVLIFSIENSSLHHYRFQMSFDALTNLRSSEQKEVYTANCQPLSTDIVAKFDILGEFQYQYKIFYALQISDVIPSGCHPLAELPPLDESCFHFSRADDGKFIDPYFPPSSYSVFGLRPPEGEEIVWKRPEEFIRDEVSLFPSKPHLPSLVQGAIDTRWLLSGAAHVCLSEDGLKKFFETPVVQKSGLYRLRVFKDRQWQTVIIDDLIPCSSASGQPLFSRNQENNVIWLMLLEKAFAKICGSYFALRGGGNLEISLTDLFGSSVIKFNHTEQPQVHALAQFLQATINESCIIVGITRGCRYHLLRKVVEYEGVLMIQLFNPWSKTNWSGDWNPDSPLWTSEAKAALWSESDNAGLTFWMKLQDYFENFTETCITTERLEQSHSRIFFTRRGDKVEPDCVFKVSIPQTQVLCFYLSQECPTNETSKYIRPTSAIGFEVKDDSFESIGTVTSTFSQDCHVISEFPAGKYILIPRLDAECFVPRFNLPSEFPLLSKDGVMHPFFLSTVIDIFAKYKAEDSEVLDFPSFLTISARLGLDISEAEFNSDYLARFSSTPQGLTREGLLDFFKHSVHTRGDSCVRQWIVSLGYEQSFFSSESRVCRFSIFTEQINYARMPFQELERMQAKTSQALP
mmetsp:Transcript_6303/g.10929  ORF Transcript_6303/g.10929 Transcript_6303/m.10929 type:complete len:741 (-) Transcript_6303:24-2246(-)